MSPASPTLFESDERQVHFEPVEAPQPIADLPDPPTPPPPAATAPAQGLDADAEAGAAVAQTAGDSAVDEEALEAADAKLDKVMRGGARWPW